MSRRIRIFILAIILISSAFIMFDMGVKAEDNYQIDGSSYQLNGGSDGFNYSASDKVTTMEYGDRSLGGLYFTCEHCDLCTYDSRKAFGVVEGIPYFTYKNIVLKSLDEKEWHVVTDESQKVGGFQISGSVGKGAIIIQKSYDGIRWVNEVVDTNFFDNFPSGKENIYSLDGNDIGSGCYYKILVVYKTARKKTDGFLMFKPEYEYKKHVEVYEIYACKNDAVISVHNLTAEKSSFGNKNDDTVTLELISKGETLKDGSVTRDGFRIDQINSVNHVKVNGKDSYDGAQYTENGKYKIEVDTPLGKKNTLTIYVYDGGSDNGVSTYFQNGNLIDGERIFLEGECPSYSKGAKIRLNQVDSNMPEITGTIQSLSNPKFKTIELPKNNRNKRTFNLDTGEYLAILYSGNTENGSVFRYTWQFSIVDMIANPHVNYQYLTDEHRRYDLMAKHYEVSWETAGGGDMMICFENYRDAYEYAYSIQQRRIQKLDNIYRYGEDAKVPYDIDKKSDRIKLTKQISKDAKAHVSLVYFDQSDPFTYEIAEGSDRLYEDLESLSFPNNVHFFPSEEEREKLIQNRIYLNDYEFMKVADYDVTKVTATNKVTGELTDLQFGIKVDEQLNESGEYIIKETNEYGKSTEYAAWFFAKNESVLEYIAYDSGNKREDSCANDSNDSESIYTDLFVIKDIINKYDDNSIVVISAPEIYGNDHILTCMIKDVNNLVLYEKGTYEIKVVDSVGHSMKLHLTISGDGRLNDAVISGKTTYTVLYDSIYGENSR